MEIEVKNVSTDLSKELLLEKVKLLKEEDRGLPYPDRRYKTLYVLEGVDCVCIHSEKEITI